MIEHLNLVGQQNILAIIFLTISIGLLISGISHKISKSHWVFIVFGFLLFAYAWISIKKPDESKELFPSQPQVERRQ